MEQRRNHLLARGPLLDEKGRLADAGYHTALVKQYDRKAIRAGKIRIKEWDYYLVYNERFALALTIDDNGYMGLDSCSFLHFGTRFQHTKSPMVLFPFGKRNMPVSSAQGDVAVEGKGYAISFRKQGSSRVLDCWFDHFFDKKPLHAHVVLMDRGEDSMVIATPFQKKDTAFYYNQKIVCMPAEGYVDFDGERYDFSPENSFGILDWGRGVWTYHNIWYWGSGSGIVNGERFGFNIGYGFGDTSAASENMLFYKGRAHKLDDVTFHIPQKNGKDDFLNPWTFDSSDGRFRMNFVPIFDRAAKTSLCVLKSDQHQVFGRFSGTAVLDDGTELKLKDFLGFAEKVENKW